MSNAFTWPPVYTTHLLSVSRVALFFLKFTKLPSILDFCVHNLAYSHAIYVFWFPLQRLRHRLFILLNTSWHFDRDHKLVCNPDPKNILFHQQSNQTSEKCARQFSPSQRPTWIFRGDFCVLTIMPKYCLSTCAVQWFPCTFSSFHARYVYHTISGGTGVLTVLLHLFQAYASSPEGVRNIIDHIS